MLFRVYLEEAIHKSGFKYNEPITDTQLCLSFVSNQICRILN